MKAVVQRVSHAQVVVDGSVVGRIDRGIVALVAVEASDGQSQCDWMASKIAALRIFPDGDKAFDKDVRDIGGAVLLISNFTVAGDCRKGRRPSLDGAMAPALAEPVFGKLIEALRAQNVRVETGRFGADMQVSLTNDGPVTFIIETDRL